MVEHSPHKGDVVGSIPTAATKFLMFTGIVTHIGKLKSRKNSSFVFQADKSFLKNIKVGSSVAVCGACLTVISKTPNSFGVELMPETLRRTVFGKLKVGDLVNFELSLEAGGRLDGHFVLGHVDGLAKVLSIEIEGNSRIFTFNVSKELAKYIAKKGSIALDGVSLTVISSDRDCFSVGIIPYTFKNTNFGKLKVGDEVNMEVDVLARYLEKLYVKN